jgi:hypothetical protein
MKRVGLLVGRERSFPEALIAEVAKRNKGVEVVLAEIDATSIDAPPAYDVLVDRISHDVTCYQPVLKLAALNGTTVINNPFWRIADDKYFNAALAQWLGVAVPKTVLLPSKSYGEDVNAQSLRNLRWVDWDKIIAQLGLPVFLKPHWGGGWRDVTRCKSKEELLAAYDKSGRLTMMVQEEIAWTQYVRCIVIGQKQVRAALWDPRLSHFDRYTKAADTMPPLPKTLEARVASDAKLLCRALGYDMNTVEFAIRDGVPYAIDFMNSAPDLDVTSLGDQHFAWVVEKMADLVIDRAKKPRGSQVPNWGALISSEATNPGGLPFAVRAAK